MEYLKNKQLRNKLKASAISSIWYSHSFAFQHKSPPHEPDHVASFIINGLPRLAELWRKWLSTYYADLQITGVFCHGYPRVVYTMNGSKQSVELADLLIVRRHYSGHSLVKEVATLIQSKMSKDGTKHISTNDPQFHLYNNWPEFVFSQSQYSNHTRNIGNVMGQSNYSLIYEQRNYPEENTDWPDSCFWSIVDDLKTDMYSDASFAAFLEEITAFERGREFFSTKDTGCEWTKLICELLKVTFNKQLKTRLFSSPKRGIDANMFFLKGKHSKAFGLLSSNGSDTIDGDFKSEEEAPGISTVLIETNDIEG